MKKVLIIGATSAIAEATARRFARRGEQLALVARNPERLKAMAKDLKIRGASTVNTYTLDVNDTDNRTRVLDTAITDMQGLDIVLVAHGTFPDQKQCEKDMTLLEHTLQSNANSVLVMVSHLANYFEQQQSGCIAVISSVAGDRGRQSNYIYGAAKGMVSIFMQGLRNRLARTGVDVVTIKPGFVDTPMTAAFKKGLLWAQPDSVARGIVRAIDKGKSEVYLPWFWWYIMFVIRNIPELVFKRMSL